MATEEKPSSSEKSQNRGLKVDLPTELESVDKGRSLVAVIGINEYAHWQKLKNAVQDAIGLQQTLIDKLGFSALIPPLINEAATKVAITSLIEDKLREELLEDDNLVLFFAGHGHTRVDKVGGKVVGETGFIVPVEGRGPKEVWSDYIQIDQLLQSISKLPARHILVILDSCHSGFAVGEAMKIYKSANRYEKDLSSRISRKVITSARREQLALDGGPVPGHSLFTGTLVDGFNWGKADLDGNGLITSSELGLFVQQQVGQASESAQTPDFGSFHLDDRGEMVISLRNQSFDAIKARAFSALQRGEITIFRELTQQMFSSKPNSPEALYLEYRLKLFECNIKQASIAIQKLCELHLPAGIIPLSQNDLETIECYLNIPSWVYGFSISEIDFPFKLELFCGSDRDNLILTKEETIGDLKGYNLKEDYIFRFRIENLSSYVGYLYLIAVDPAGRIESVPLWSWENEGIDWTGLEGVQFSNPFRLIRDVDFNGINELRFISSPQRIAQLFRPQGVATRGVGAQVFQDFNPIDLMKLRTKSIFYSVI